MLLGNRCNHHSCNRGRKEERCFLAVRAERLKAGRFIAQVDQQVLYTVGCLSKLYAHKIFVKKKLVEGKTKNKYKAAAQIETNVWAHVLMPDCWLEVRSQSKC
jgi:hypothetical protein